MLEAVDAGRFSFSKLASFSQNSKIRDSSISCRKAARNSNILL